MTAAWPSRAPFLCLLCTALWHQGSAELLWRTPGKDVTIQCRPDTAKQMESLSVKMGLTESDVFHVEHTRPEPLIQETFKGRLQYSGEYPDLDILITNLALNDTGPYWCLYHKYNNIKKQTETFKAKGSVLLVVSDEHEECPEPYQDKSLVAITVAAAVLFCTLAGFLLWIVVKTKGYCCTAKPRPATGNQVYEDMRGTLRR